MGDVHIHVNGCVAPGSEALDRIAALERLQAEHGERFMALVDEFRQRAEALNTLEASVTEAFRVVRERLTALETSNMDAEAMKAELATIGAEMDSSLTDIGAIVTANTGPRPAMAATQQGRHPPVPQPQAQPAVQQAPEPASAQPSQQGAVDPGPAPEDPSAPRSDVQSDAPQQPKNGPIPWGRQGARKRPGTGCERRPSGRFSVLGA